jgi:hypothetical protein
MEVHAVRTWFDQKHGVVLVEDDVASIVREIREIDPRIHVFWNEQTQRFDLVESCLDGTDRLIFSTSELDARVPQRLRMGDSWLGGNPSHVVPDDEDFLAAMEAEQEREQAGVMERLMDRVHDAGERFAWALGDGKFGPGYHQSIRVKRDVNGPDDTR